MNIEDIIQNAKDREESPLAKEIAAKLVILGYEHSKHNPYSFNAGVNHGESKAYSWVLEQLRNKTTKV